MSEKYKAFTDDELVTMARNGDVDAEEYLIQKYRDTAKSRARLYFMVGGDKEDIVQEGMIGIFKAIRSYDPEKEASFRTFAELCISRQIITAIKQAGRLKHSPLNTSVSLWKPVSEEDNGNTLADILSSDSNSDPETVLLLTEIIDYVTKEDSKVFSELEMKVWMEYIQGKSCAQIAEEMGRTPKSVDNAIQRTKRKINLYFGGTN
ncbi:MAG: RNA polymerase sporulation sigma factor SigH [Firmicutes bacterium]|nr:RNA polymerase sporulation sigma factor SigH [Bacillota bacterium]MBQ2271694.1 RNA polymerase sporulation sigma factor SigH [Bacillota bacterium]MBQ5798038.1 RNA polymerase sporulation sigma factor SigH [Bacillota bacterium]MBR5001473.1 RNA polymerase sporulation sigma factor SigH [Bacillota bacterium]